MNSQRDGALNPDLLQQYAIVDKEADFENALQNGSGKVLSGGLISVKSDKTKVEKQGKKIENQKNEKSEKKRNKHDHSSKSNKKRKS